jgi:ribose 5-phosphate isomerase B
MAPGEMWREGREVNTMHIAVSSDEHGELVDFVCANLAERGHRVTYFGPGAGEESADWPVVTRQAAEMVRDGSADQAIVICWTGTGAALAANKVRTIRAALVHDAPTAAGARQWNHANVLALSLRATSLPVAREILDSWFATPLTNDDWNLRQIARIGEIECRDRDRDRGRVSSIE